jgi:hypothetical protein
MGRKLQIYADFLLETYLSAVLYVMSTRDFVREDIRMKVVVVITHSSPSPQAQWIQRHFRNRNH